MKGLKYIASLIFLIFFLVFQVDAKNDSWIISDREVYVSGEYVLAKIFTPQNQDFKVVSLSLTSIDGYPVANVNLGITNHQASGYLYLPDSLQTGSFLLTAYSSHFQKRPLFSKEILVLNRFENSEEELQITRAKLDSLIPDENNGIQTFGLQSSYKQRKQISVQIQLDNELKNKLDGELSIVVSESVPDWKPQMMAFEKGLDNALLLTEYQGVVMQGVVSNKQTGEPMEGATVFLTKADSIPYFDYYLTAEDGQFYFLLKDFYGTQSLVVKAEKEGENELLKISLDDQWLNQNIKIESQPIKITDKLQNYFADAISAVTFNKIFKAQSLVLQEKNYHTVYPFPFYGRPTVQVDPDDFFDLPDFNEISKELLFLVRFREHEGHYSLSLIDRQLEKFFPDPPLILLDGVPATVEQIAPFGTKDIDWIDVVPYQQFYGNKRFDGILAVYTKQLDASRIFASDRVLKLNFETLQGEFYLPDLGSRGAHVPDFRQVLYWNPKLKVQETVHLNFSTSDIKGRFKIQVNGRTKDGELNQRIQYFTVTE